VSSVPSQEPSRDVVESPRWLTRSRQVIIFALGVWMIVYSVRASSKNIAYVVAGFILVGIIPVEEVIRHAAQLGIKRKERRDARQSPTSSPSSPASPGSSLP